MSMRIKEGINHIIIKRQLSTCQSQMFAQILSYVLFSSFFCLFAIFLIHSLSSNPTSSLASHSSAAVSSEESVDSALITHSLLSKLAAIKSSLAASASSMATSSQDASACRTVQAKHHEDSGAQRFLKSLHYGIPSSQGFIDSESKRYYYHSQRVRVHWTRELSVHPRLSYQ